MHIRQNLRGIRMAAWILLTTLGTELRDSLITADSSHYYISGLTSNNLIDENDILDDLIRKSSDGSSKDEGVIMT